MKDHERVIHKGLSLREAIIIARAHGAEVVESYKTGETLFKHPKMHTRQRVDNKRKDVARTLVYWLRRLRQVAPATPPVRIEAAPAVVRDRSINPGGNGSKPLPVPVLEAPPIQHQGPPVPRKGQRRAAVRFVEYWAPRLREAVAAFPEGIKATEAISLIEFPRTSAGMKSRVIRGAGIALYRREKQGVAWMAPTMPTGRKPINRSYTNEPVISIPSPVADLPQAPPLPETVTIAPTPAAAPAIPTLRSEIIAAAEEAAAVWLRLAKRLRKSAEKTS